MTIKEKQLAAKLLEMAREEFSNHGCNDVDDSVYEGWTIEERRALVLEYHQLNEGREDPEDYDPSHLNLTDTSIMYILAHKLMNE